jgi:hypothetical protein
MWPQGLLFIHCPKQHCSKIYISNYIKHWLTNGKYSMEILTEGKEQSWNKSSRKDKFKILPLLALDRHTKKNIRNLKLKIKDVCVNCTSFYSNSVHEMKGKGMKTICI